MRLLLWIVLLLSSYRSTYAIDFLPPPLLSFPSPSPVFSVIQDNKGAIWFNTASGLYRFNGHALTKQASRTLYLSRFATSDGDAIYLNCPDGLMSFSTHNHFSVGVETIAEPLPEYSPILAEEDDLIYARYNFIYSYCDGESRVLCALPEGTYVRSLQRLADGRLLVATFESGLGVVSDGVFESCLSMDTRIQATYLDADDILWVGTSHDGLFKIDTQNFSVLASYRSPDARPLLDVRCFAYGCDGNLYFGTASGLFRLDSEGIVERLSIDGVLNNSICDVFVDREGYLWVGTFDNGVYYANLGASPFAHLASDLFVGTTRGLVMSDDGTLWVASDPVGLLKYKDGEWSEIDTMEEYKFQGAFYDEVTKELFIGNWEGMVRFDPGSGKHRLIRFADDISIGSRIPVLAVRRCGEELYIASTIGAFLFNPEVEDRISRCVEGVDKRVNAIVVTDTDQIFFAGEGLYLFSGGHAEYLEGYRDITFSDCIQSSDGSLWGAMYGCLIRIDNVGQRAVFDMDSCGFPRTSVNYICPAPDGRIVAGTSKGITILDPSARHCMTYDRFNGLRFKSTWNGKPLCLPDGTLLLGGNGDIEKLDPDLLPAPTGRVTLAFDGIAVNDVPLETLPAAGKTLSLDHNASNIRFDVATFDYTSVDRFVYSYRLEGLDSEWHEFDISEPINCMNMSPGRYRIRVREAYNADNVRAEIGMTFRISPVWYISVPFMILWILILSGVVFYILHGIYSRKLLSRRLAMEEEQNARQSSFFLDLSLKMRTPLNLMIGQIERYFKEYGFRTRGVEDIQDVYGKATEIRGLISDFVDDSNGHLKETPRYSKVLNAATGAVERYLFSGDIDVPLLCKELNMGKTKLTQTLEEASGMTPREFIEDIRLKHAAQMILEGNHTVAEVSDSLGFSTPKYFAVRFKHKFGCPPSQYGRQ